jgi:hypothetical protein
MFIYLYEQVYWCANDMQKICAKVIYTFSRKCANAIRPKNHTFNWPPTMAISFPLVRTTTLGQSVYHDIALHISNYYINMHTTK